MGGSLGLCSGDWRSRPSMLNAFGPLRRGPAYSLAAVLLSVGRAAALAAVDARPLPFCIHIT
jgi:hypothetical protein